MDTKRLMALTLLIAIAAQFPTANFSRRTAQPDNSLHTMTNLTVAQEELIHSGLKTYERAGLRLPGIQFIGFDDKEQCNGRVGMAWRRGRETQIWLCTRETGPFENWVVLHELAHTWDYEMLTPDVRDEFLELRDLEGWRAGEWHERGSEQTAEIIVWGIIGHPVEMTRFDNTGCSELRQAFLTLTGEEPDQVCE